MKRFLLISSGMAILLLLLVGCMVGPKYVKPSAPLTPGFKETTDWKEADGWKTANPEDALVHGKWWELYADAKLNELEEQVDPSNQTLKIAEANFRQARAAIRFNRAAEAPTIGTSPSISVDPELPPINPISQLAWPTMVQESSRFPSISPMKSTYGEEFAGA